TPSVMTTRDVLRQVGGFDEDLAPHVETWELWLRIAARFSVGYLSMPLAVHRPGGSTTGAIEETHRSEEMAIEKTAPLCGTACAIHSGDPDRCVRERRLALERRHRGARPAPPAAAPNLVHDT